MTIHNKPHDLSAHIHSILSARPIGTQRELSEALAEQGVRVSQATLSRELHRLGALKTVDSSGKTRYALFEEQAFHSARQSLAGCRESLRLGQAMVVLTLQPASNSQHLAEALARCRLPGILSVLAGIDSVILVAQDDRAADHVRHRMTQMAHAS